MYIQRFALVLAAVAAVATAPFTVDGNQSHQQAVPQGKQAITLDGLAPLHNAEARFAIPKQYVVLFKRGTTANDVVAVEKVVDPSGKDILFRYLTGTLGFAAKDVEKDTLEKVLANPHVLLVEADQYMRASSVSEPAWATGIDRIDQRLLPLNNTFQYTETGEGVHAYVLDTGIRTTHEEFENRASAAFPLDDNDGGGDCSGHGTHVAATLGGKNYGVAKKVQLHSVRVMGCNDVGTMSNVIAGVEWITGQKKRNQHRPTVANMSISGETGMPSLDEKIQDSIESGVTYVVAAHNRATDACGYSPARIPDAITVGALNPRSDVRWVMSNDGDCVDLFAPGVAILSAGNSDDTAKAFRAGTSMAAAHVAGVVALYLQLHPRATPSEVWSAIDANSNAADTPGWPGITDWQGWNIAGTAIPNKSLHWGPVNDGYDDGFPPSATSVIVTADRATSIQGKKVTFTATVALLTPRTSSSREVVPHGTVQFFLNGAKTGPPVRLDPKGRARWTTSVLLPQTHRISARYLPSARSEFLPSNSSDYAHTTMKKK